ncbi:MAG: HVO_0758 family zinc finger protein [Halobacteriales archaeon]
MKSVRQGLRDDELARDTYDRLSCTRCEVGLRVVDDPDEVGTVRVCPSCGSRWREL